MLLIVGNKRKSVIFLLVCLFCLLFCTELYIMFKVAPTFGDFERCHVNSGPCHSGPLPSGPDLNVKIKKSEKITFRPTCKTFRPIKKIYV